jgi:hypothetical protein
VWCGEQGWALDGTLGWEATWWLSAPSPLPSVSSFSLHLLLGGAVCAVLGTARAYSRGAGYACLLRAQVWLWTGGLRGMLTVVSDAKNREKCCSNCVERCARSVKYMSLFHCHTLPPLPHTRTSPPFTHARIQSVSKYRLGENTRVRG